MIARPLELASKLRPEPRSFVPMFFVNVGALALFFSLFWSRFVLAPGLPADFLPEVAGSTANARATTHTITVVNAGQIFAGDGPRTPAQLDAWLHEQAKTQPHPTLLVLSNRNVPLAVGLEIAGMARAAGFETVQIASVDPGTQERAAPGGAIPARP